MISFSQLLNCFESRLTGGRIAQILVHKYLNEELDFSMRQEIALQQSLNVSNYMHVTSLYFTNSSSQLMHVPNVFKTEADVDNLYRKSTFDLIAQRQQMLHDQLNKTSDQPVSKKPPVKSTAQPMQKTMNIVRSTNAIIHNTALEVSTNRDPDNKTSVVDKLRAKLIPVKKRELNNHLRRTVAKNDVYGASSELFGKLGCRLDTLIYAPPCSGKTTFNDGRLSDTDDLFSWRMDTKHGITNMSHLLKYARKSVAIIPSKREFERRCKIRGLPYTDQWYQDALDNSADATVVVLSDGFVSDILTDEQYTDFSKLEAAAEKGSERIVLGSRLSEIRHDPLRAWIFH